MTVPKPSPAWHRHVGDAVAGTSYAALRLAGWMAITMLASLGVATLFFLMIGDFTALGFFSQIGNLGTRFVAADELRRAAFVSQVRLAAALVFVAVAAARYRLLLPILLPRKVDRHG